MNEISELKQQMAEDRPKDWDALPDIDLYMDQVVLFLSRQSTGGKAPAITSAMINNYVKDGLLPRANGKRYSREHLASLTAISLLKNVLTVKDMQLILKHFGTGCTKESYNEFLSYLDDSYNGVNSALSADLQQEDLARTALILALAACASKTACENILNILRDREEIEEANDAREAKETKDAKARKREEKDSAKKAKS